MNDFFPALTPPKSLIRNQNNYKYQANMDINP